jgi:hypothetical protein
VFLYDIIDSMQEFPTNPVTSPTLDTDPGIIRSAKQFSDNLTLDLTDTEIKQALKIIITISKKWQARFRYKFNNVAAYSHLSESQVMEEAAKLIDQFETELHHTLAEKLQLIATVDMAPVFEGQPPVVELIGALDTHSSAKYGLDHERKEYEVKKANERGEAFLGEKYEPNPNTKRRNSIKDETNRRQKKSNGESSDGDNAPHT